MSSTTEKTWTLKELLDWSRDYFEKNEVDSARLTAELLLAHLLGVQRIRLYTDLNRPMEKDELSRYRELVLRRVRGEPTQYLLGTQEFYGRSFKSDARALIPRPETELVVLRVLRHLPKERPALVVDVGCGSGVIGLTVAAERPLSQVVLLDVSRDALSLTHENAERLSVADRAFLAVGDLLDPLKLPELRNFAAQHRQNWAQKRVDEERKAQKSAAPPVEEASGAGESAEFTETAESGELSASIDAPASSAAFESSDWSPQNPATLPVSSGEPEETGDSGDAGASKAALLQSYAGFVPGPEAPFIAEVIVANLPYVPEGELASLAPHIREHEPHLALISGEDGLDLIRRLIPSAAQHLLPGGLLVLEHAEDQKREIAALFDPEIWQSPVCEKDLAGLERFTWALRV